MEIGGGQGLTAPQVWSTPVRTLTADPATDAGAASLVWQHVSRLLTIGGGAIPSGSNPFSINQGPIGLTSSATTVKINTSGTPGVLLALGFNVATILAGGTVNANIEYVIDGVFSISLNLYTNAIVFDPSLRTIAQNLVGSGTNVGDIISYLMPIQFGSSLIVRINVSSSTLTTGALNMAAIYFTHP